MRVVYTNSKGEATPLINKYIIITEVQNEELNQHTRKNYHSIINFNTCMDSYFIRGNNPKEYQRQSYIQRLELVQNIYT